MTLEEIKQALAEGKKVFWSTYNYEVIKDEIGQYLIHYKYNEHYVGLTHRDGVTLKGNPEEYYIASPTPKYRIGQRVFYINGNGVRIGVKTITDIHEYPKGSNHWRYYFVPTDTPWFSVEENNLFPINEVLTI